MDDKSTKAFTEYNSDDEDGNAATDEGWISFCVKLFIETSIPEDKNRVDGIENNDEKISENTDSPVFVGEVVLPPAETVPTEFLERYFFFI